MSKNALNLQCENLVNPLGIDSKRPRFSWINIHDLKNQNQTAFQIIVSSDYNLAQKETGDVWDSGKIFSSDNINISYSGKPLSSFKKYFWRVKWWDSNDESCSYSEVATFETAFLNKTEWKAKWITQPGMTEFHSEGTYLSNQYMGDYIQCYSPYFRKEFEIIKEVKEARAYVCGLGYYELRINGKKVGDHVLDPAQTDYQKIALYSSFDITNYLKNKNAIGILLGNGRHIKYYGFDSPKVILQIRIVYSDNHIEEIITDESWKSSHGPLTENSIYNGEIFDGRLELSGWDFPGFEDLNWKKVQLVSGPELKSQMVEPVRITEELLPKKIYSPKPGIFIFDFGQNFSGWVRMKMKGQKGTQIRIRYSENVFEDGSLNTLANQKAESMNIIFLKGDKFEEYEPRFTYHGFRYVEISGFRGFSDIISIAGCFVHSDVKRTGEFYCSNEIINKIHSNIIWGQLSNLMSVPTDCCQRDERHGWMGDAHLSGEESIFNFNMHSFLVKYLNDIKLSQKEDGSISDVVPPYYRHLYPADPAWGAAYIIFVWYVYFYYGDVNILTEHYESLKRYINFLKANSDKHIIKNLGKFGDWCPPGSVPPKMTPLELTSTWFYYHDVLLFSKIAAITGNEGDSKKYNELSEEIKKAFNSEFLIEDMYKSLTLVLTENMPSQTSQVLPLYLDMVPDGKKEKVFDKLLYSVINRCDYHIDTGIIGTRYLLDVLSSNGRTDVAYKVVTRKTYPGWGYMVECGATTLWERWEYLTNASMNSHNHIMFGSVDSWFYRIIAGISCIIPGWKKIRYKPPILNDLDFARASLDTVMGRVQISWQKDEKSYNISLKVPVGSKGEVFIPLLWNEFVLNENGKTIFENNHFKTSENYIEYKGIEEKYLKFIVGSGEYYFELLRK